MLKSLKGINFQSHKDTFVEFSPGINAFVGESDQGKSALLRLLKWIVKNRPLGGDFKSWFADGKEVVKGELRLSEGGEIVHIREGDSNFYELDGERLEAHGAEVPDVVVDALGLGPYNISSQHDTYFLLQDSPGEVARQLNSVVRLDEIDEASRKINQLSRQTDQDLKVRKQRASELEEASAEFGHLPEVEKLITSVADKHEKLEEVIGKKSQLFNCLTKLNDLKEEIGDLEDWLKVEDSYVELRKKADKAFEIKDKAKGLGVLLGQLANGEKEIEVLDLFLEAETQVIDLSGLMDEYLRLCVKKDDFSRLLVRIEDNEKRIEAKEKQHQSLSEQYLEGAKKLGICPVCFTKIGKDQLEHIREHIDG